MKSQGPRGYALLVAGHIVSTFGSSIYLIALVVYLARLTNSAAVIGSVQFAAYLPAALFGPVAGALVDRWNRKRIIVWTDVIRGAVMLLAAASALVWGRIPLAVIFATTVITGASGVFFVPAVHALVPDLVPAPQLKRANGMRTGLNQAANLAGSAAGAGLLILLGAPMLFALNGASFLLSGLSETAIRPAPHARPPATSIRRAMTEGIAVLRRQSPVRFLVGVQVTVNLLLPPVVVSLPFVIRDHWRIPEAYFGFYFAAVLAGSILSFLLLSKPAVRRSAETTAYRASLPVLALFLGALAFLTLPGPASLPGARWILFPLFVAAGAAMGTLHLIGVTRIQQGVLPGQRGRVFAVVETVTAAALPVVYALSGLAAELLRDTPSLLYGGVAVVAAAAAVVVVRSRPLARMIASDGATAEARSPEHQR